MKLDKHAKIWNMVVQYFCNFCTIFENFDHCAPPRRPSFRFCSRDNHLFLHNGRKKSFDGNVFDRTSSLIIFSKIWGQIWCARWCIGGHWPAVIRVQIPLGRQAFLDLFSFACLSFSAINKFIKSFTLCSLPLVAVQWGYISCKWRYRSLMQACCFFHLTK